jgi:arylsulfatase A-like enzyme
MTPRWRYRFVVGLIWFAVFAAAVTGWLYARSSGPAYGPVIVISIESLRADHLPVYGYTGVRTPAIDGLAADSVVFDRAYAHSPLTLPSHISLLSGLLPFQHGVRDEAGFSLPPAVSLLPQWLHRRGFKTGGVVSSCLLREETGLGPAFGFFDDDPGGGGTADADLACGRDGAESLTVAEHWIESIGTARFFLFLHIDAPTSPAAVPGRPARVSPYDTRIAYADEVVGRLVAFLKKRGLYSGGILVLTSDHGEGLGDHGEAGHGLFLYEAAVRTPLIVKLPRRDGGGRHSAALVQQIDIAPTILDLVGAPRPSGLGGRSLRRLLDSATTTIPDRQVYAESLEPRDLFGWSETESLTNGRYRYIRSSRPELYDLAQDPKERVNLVGSDPKTAQEMRAALEALAGQSPMPVPSAVAEPDRARLAVLGYVTGLPGVAPDIPGDQLPDPKGLVAVSNHYVDASRLAAQGQADAAIDAFRTVVADAPSLAAGWDRLAGLLVARGRFKEAGDALTSLLKLYPEDGRAAEADRRLQTLLGPAPTADQFAMAAAVWMSLGEKARASDVRSAARKAVGDAAVRKAEAALK